MHTLGLRWHCCRHAPRPSVPALRALKPALRGWQGGHVVQEVSLKWEERISRPWWALHSPKPLTTPQCQCSTPGPAEACPGREQRARRRLQPLLRENPAKPTAPAAPQASRTTPPAPLSTATSQDSPLLTPE